ncbi:MAG: hypothetical protein LBT16_07300 [Treponema sp.]|jgi:hypothetical protein|nr:hypothetical protein [Treponema sp.]
MIKHGEEGFASTQFMAFLFFVSTLVLILGLYSSTLVLAEERTGKANRVFDEMNSILFEVVEEMRRDPTPEVNSSEDPVWAWHNKNINGYTVKLRPLSDRLNLNYVRKNVFDKTGLSLILAPGKNSSDLQQFREDHGIFLLSEDYSEFFIHGTSAGIRRIEDPPLDEFQKYFSCYGWANINLTDEFAARSLAFSLTGRDEISERLRYTIEKLLVEKKSADRNNLSLILGGDYEVLFPFVNTEALMNINYIDETLLGELLAYPDYGVPFPDRRRREILNRRELEGIAPDDIAPMLGIDPESPLLNYLGSVTWFWEISITGTNKTQRTVLCRLPPGEHIQPMEVEYQIIEQRYY